MLSTGGGGLEGRGGGGLFGRGGGGLAGGEGGGGGYVYKLLLFIPYVPYIATHSGANFVGPAAQNHTRT